MRSNALHTDDIHALLGVLWHFDLSLVLLDGRRGVVFTTRAAGGLLLADDGIGVRDGQLVVRDQAGARALDEAMRLARQHAAPEVVPVDRPSGRLSYQVTVIPTLMNSSTGEDRLVLRISDPTADIADAERFLRDMYSLSGAEAAIAALLGQGMDVKQVAASRGTTAATVRAQLQQVFDKVGVRRQSDLVRLLFRGSIGSW
ncbi:MAG: DNA-binding CsgD family transcriptional regulator [Myxococcota bacterium]|jgi:DNA-binding CsgD family transcriptional regulator